MNKIKNSEPNNVTLAVDAMPPAAGKGLVKNPLLPLHDMCQGIPDSLSNPAKIVLHMLFSCFDKHQNVHEGTVGDIIWGFHQCDIPPELTLAGLRELEDAGYVHFKPGADLLSGVKADSNVPVASSWVGFLPPLLDLISIKKTNS